MRDRKLAADSSEQLARLEEQLQNVTQERDRLRAELDLRNSALDAASSHFMITDVSRRGGRIVYVNRALARDHGYERDELLGAYPTVLVPQDLNPTQQQQIAAASRAGQSLRVDIRSRRKDGSAFWAGISLSPLRDETGRVTHYVSIGADITTRLQEAEHKRQLQEQLVSEMRERERMAIELRFSQKLEAVGQLAAGIAHEINTPIQYVGDSLAFLEQATAELGGLLEAYREALQRLGATGSADAAELERLRKMEGELDLPFLQEEIPKALKRTTGGVGRVAEIVRAMKEFGHRDGAEQAAADINHAIETTLTVARNEYKYVAQVETTLRVLPDVVCNVGELNQALLNLIVNAAHAIAAAGKNAILGRIAISTVVAGDGVVITIEDNGCGIPEANLERIFDPFFTTKEVGKGTGQGLAIVRSIVVERHGGTIRVESKVGTGTRFIVTLPTAGRTGGASQ